MKVGGVGDLVCTHLSSQLAPPPLYVGPPVVVPFLYSSYAEQHSNELMTLFDVIKKSGMQTPILLGDFNHGPARTDGVVAEFPFYYGLMNARGFVTPYVLTDGRCTFCIDNPLTGGLFPDTIIDHIYITTDTTKRVICARRFFDVVSPPIGTPLSDHYGVKVRLYNIRNEECSALQQCRYNCASQIKDLSPFEPNFNEVCFS
ncbi:hypothetical protein GBAR_LOCUS20517 [Geodia barretti]|uniref:Endonuclease/exonuclease/phosphatase domain-containing protein n=1 Tax=Geodia barretti TaxID=519541 RepID=A0AA35SVU8_GEOBA|nr:hypothetical protein GBAR_LOCUS20517 [Geodia barretti]